MKTKKNILLSVVTVVVLFLQLASPITVFADDEITPPSEETTEVATTPDPVEATDVPEIVSTPLPPEPTVVPIETETPIPPTDSTEPPTVEVVETEVSLTVDDQPVMGEEVIEEPTVAEILAEIPAGTDLVVLDENGEPEPLATQDAAEIIVNGDPIWCPDTQTTPTPGANGCTGSFPSLSALVAGFVPTDNGTIWIQSGNATGSAVYIYGSCPTTPPCNWSSASNYSLNLQGGWSGAYGDTTIGSNSVFNESISIWGWNGNVTVNNITVDGTWSTGLYVSTSQDVTIGSSTFSNNGYDGTSDGGGTGASINANKVTISNSTFSNNGGSGMYGGSGTGAIITANNDVTISDSTFSNNGGSNSYGGSGTGVSISNANSVTITNSTFSGHYDYGFGYGIKVNYVNTTTLNCNTFQNNDIDINVDVPNNPCENDNNDDNDDDDFIIIPVDGKSVSFSIDCSLFSGYIAAWPNGDRVLISCVPNGTVTIDRVENTNLPDDLDVGYQYASGFNVRVFQNGAPLSVMPEGGSIQVSFVAEESDAQYGIMYWDAGDWLLLDEFQLNPSGASMQFPFGTSDFRTILSGTRFVSGNPSRENVTTNFPGAYVLVIQE